MKQHYTLALRTEGTLEEVIAAGLPEGGAVELSTVISSLRELAFIVETVAHLQGKEAALLPAADNARALIAKLEGAA
jgi:hypothetical protein